MSIIPVNNQSIHRPVNYTRLEVHGCVYEVTYHPSDSMYADATIIHYEVEDNDALVQDLTEELYNHERCIQ